MPKPEAGMSLVRRLKGHPSCWWVVRRGRRVQHNLGEAGRTQIMLPFAIENIFNFIPGSDSLACILKIILILVHRLSVQLPHFRQKVAVLWTLTVLVEVGVLCAGEESTAQRQLLLLGPCNWVDGNTITDQGQI